MTNNDVIKSIRYILNVNDKKLADIFELGGKKVSLEDIILFFKDEEDPQYLRCDDFTMAHFLDGVIYFKRGKDESKPPFPFEIPISNNLILKKLRVAFALKEPDMHEIMSDGGYNIGRAEMSALLRKKGQPNYRECGDQVLRYFLKGLANKYRK
jgi:uncharacterized protein YehS (DUF1456 family)